ncbi:LexA family protein [Paenibacillus sp. SN-8-1]|uniref:LexA family protein n=1 Tax=Paenibacillus sp. SN-8-1 TaxID=3435409 RepID=UPI003D9A6627
MNTLTKRQAEALMHIQVFTTKHNYPPTNRELADIMGVASSSTIHGYLDRLEKKGFIKREEGKPRALKVIRNAV